MSDSEEEKKLTEEELEAAANAILDRIFHPPPAEITTGPLLEPGRHVKVIRGIFKDRIGLIYSAGPDQCFVYFREIFVNAHGYPEREKFLLLNEDLSLLSAAELDLEDFIPESTKDL